MCVLVKNNVELLDKSKESLKENSDREGVECVLFCTYALGSVVRLF
jgi:hypothetical protein